MGIEFELPDGATPIDPDESEGLIPALSTQAELNGFEALNIAEALAWAETSRAIRSNLLAPNTLNALHKRMFGKTWRWAGQYRKTQKSIGVEAWRIPLELKNLVDDVRCWRELGSYESDEIVVRFHHRLVSIHCYPNGNGRHARLAADLLCEAMGSVLFTWGSGNLTSAGETRQRYIHALRSADQWDLGPLLEFVRS